MVTSLIFNLFVGSKDKPVDWKYIGRDASLPIRKHKLQRLFNRKVHESMVAFDAFGQTVHPKDVTKAKRCLERRRSECSLGYTGYISGETAI